MRAAQPFWAALLALSAVVSACSPIVILNGLTPSDTYTRVEAIPYAEGERHKLDVYRPTNTPANRPRPVVLFFYGGNWTSGRREDYVFAGEAFASKGFVIVIADYRLYPQVRFPGFLDDSAKALAWTLTHIAEYGGDPARIALVGHSAGAYNAAMLAFNPLYRSNAVKAFVGLAGPYDFLPLTSDTNRAIFGDPASITTQPIHFVDSSVPPTLLITAIDDTTVNPGNSARLAARLRALNVDVSEIAYPDLGHVRLVAALAKPLRGLAPVLDDAAAFIDGHTR